MSPQFQKKPEIQLISLRKIFIMIFLLFIVGNNGGNQVQNDGKNEQFNNRDNIDELLEAGEDFLKNRNYNEACKLFEQVLGIDSDNIQALLGFGIAYWEISEDNEQEINRVLQYFDQVLELDENNTIARVEKGKVLTQKAKITGKIEFAEEANKCFDRVLSVDKENIEASVAKGQALYFLGRYEDALIPLNLALEKEPKNILANIFKGWVLNSLGRYEDAIKNFDIALTLDPFVPGALFEKGFAYLNLKEYKKAIDTFDEYLDLRNQPQRRDALCYKGYALASLNQIEDAERQFSKAKKEDPFFSAAWMGKGFIQEKKVFFAKQQEYQTILSDYEIELVNNAKKVLGLANTYQGKLLQDFRYGLSIVQWMFVIQFITGIGLLLLAVAIALYGNNELLALLIGGSGAATSIATLIFSSPVKLQKNRVDFAQWMMAYFNWTNTLFAVNTLFAQKAESKEKIEWKDVETAHNYLCKMTADTINLIERCCEFTEEKEDKKASGSSAGEGTENK
jgi:tetratricopeptide (TPR) repeat protein